MQELSSLVRPGVFGTAEQLMKDFVEHEGKKLSLPWSRPPRWERNVSRAGFY